MRHIEEYLQRHTRATTDSPPGRPLVDAGCKDLVVVTAAAWDAIRQANDPPEIFRYGGCPTRIETGDQGEPVLRHMGLDRMRHTLARAAEFFEVRTKGDETHTEIVAPPKDVVRDILATPNMPLPILTRVVEAPVFAPDGSRRGSRLGGRPAK